MTASRLMRWFGVAAGLIALVALEIFLRRSLEHADQHLYAFLPYFYPAGEKLLFHGQVPLWRLFLPLPEFSGAWAGSLIVTHLVEMRIGVANTWYLFNCLMLVGSFVAALLVVDSLAFAFTFAIAMGFGTQFIHAYTVTGGMASPLVTLVWEALLVCSYRVVVAETHRAAWKTAFAVSALVAALTYEGWLDVAAFIIVAAPVFAVLAAGRAPAVRRRLIGVAIAMLALSLVYVYLKTSFGNGQTAGSESDVVFNYHLWAPAIEDVVSNIITQLYISVTNFLPAIFLSSTALFTLGADKLVELQAGYHEPYAYLVPMHYVFLWRYAAGAVALACAYLVVVLGIRTWREPARDRIAVLVSLLLMIMAGSTHALIKIRPMKTMPVLGYHVTVGVIGAAMLIAYGVMVVWRDWRGTGSRVAVTACVWGVIFYGALTRPVMLNHMAVDVGLPGLYPNPMNALRVMLGRPEDATGDLTGYRLVKYVPPSETAKPPAPVASAPALAQPPAPASASPAPKAPSPSPAPAPAPVVLTLGDVAPSLPTTVPELFAWERPADVKVSFVSGAYVVEGNASGGYQLTSPLITVPAMKQLLIKATGTVERGRICLGALDGSQQHWLHPPGAPTSEFLIDTGVNRAIRLVFAACPGNTDAPRFHVQSISYAVLQ